MPTAQRKRREATRNWPDVAKAMGAATGKDFDRWMHAARFTLSWDECCAAIRDHTGMTVPKATLIWWYPEHRDEEVKARRHAAALARA